MSESDLTRASAYLVRPFTLAGKWRSILFLRSGYAALALPLAPFLLLAPAGVAIARPETGPTSSASISISVSVAPRFGLRAKPDPLQPVDEAASNGSGFCIAINGKQPTLPLRLARAKAGENGDQPAGRGEPLPRCDRGADTPADSGQRNAGSADLFIISPE